MKTGIVTLGCDKNTVDSEYIAGLLEESGAEPIVSGETSDLDAVIINTCGFIDCAKEESIDRIMEWVDEKNRRENEGEPPLMIYVVGCLAERYGGELLAEIPEIDGIAGVGQWRRVAKMAAAGKSARSQQYISLPEKRPSMKITKEMPRKKVDSYPYGFLKIADGCSHRCSFCAIPLIKGNYTSVPRKILLEEAKSLLARGAKEINLIAQDINHYGRDLYEKYGLCDLIEDIASLPGKFWIRLLYLYPEPIPDRLFELFRDVEKLCPYMDVPLQHLSPDMLKKMRRPVKIVQFLVRLFQWREEIPGLTIRTAFIVGHPGEGRKEFGELVEGVVKFRFDRMGAFLYSPEENTAAFKMKPEVSRKTAVNRLNRLMELQSEIMLKKNQDLIGQTKEVLVEEYLSEEKLYTGRTKSDAPEVDCSIYFKSQQKLNPGDFVNVKITGAEAFDLYGAG